GPAARGLSEVPVGPPLAARRWRCGPAAYGVGESLAICRSPRGARPSSSRPKLAARPANAGGRSQPGPERDGGSDIGRSSNGMAPRLFAIRCSSFAARECFPLLALSLVHPLVRRRRELREEIAESCCHRVHEPFAL